MQVDDDDVCKVPFGPVAHAVEDVRRVDDARAALLRLAAQVSEQVDARAEVEVGGELIEQQELERVEQAEEEALLAQITMRVQLLCLLPHMRCRQVHFLLPLTHLPNPLLLRNKCRP